MEKHSAEVWVKIFSVWSFVAAGLSLLMAITGVLFVLGGIMANSMQLEGDTPQETAQLEELRAMGAFGFFAAFGVLFVVIGLCFAALYIVRGVFLWKHKTWARILTIVMAWVMGVLSLVFLLVNMIAMDIIAVFLNIITIAICVIEIILLQFHQEVKGLFK